MSNTPFSTSSISVPSDFQVTDEITAICEKVKQGQSLFITGRAGTGKSTLLSYLRSNVLSENHVVVGFTGVSALNVNGLTIHRFFNFKVDVTIDHVKSDDYLPKNRNVMRSLKTLVIDEVSMVRADLMDCIDAALRRFGPRKGLPFGGVQVLLLGDLHQLAPIVKRSEMKFINLNYATPFFFSSHATQELEYEIIELTHIFRQTDPEFISILNAVRNDELSEEMLTSLNRRVEPDFYSTSEDLYLTLVTKKSLANDINLSKLREIKSQNFHSAAFVTGGVAGDEFPTDINLNFKVGAQIMLVNNDGQERWVNGTLATIEEVHINPENFDDSHVVVRLAENGELHQVNRFTWEVKRPRTQGDRLVYDTIGSFTQFPFLLAWAITIHKSQGKTFDKVIIDLSEPTFTSGQLYVALSRCRSLEGTVLRKPVLSEHVIVDERIADFPAIALSPTSGTLFKSPTMKNGSTHE
jgi:ATP-dependent exoDNAse (exonuclease V) alpha subunit